MKRFLALLLTTIMVLTSVVPGLAATAPACTEHNYVLEYESSGTCLRPGFKDFVCSVCGDRTSKETGLGEHEYIQADVSMPTCTSDGWYLLQCTVCGDTKKETVKSYGHNYTSEIQKNATCTENGKRVKTCTECGDTKTETISATGHAYNNSRIIREATCTENGLIAYICVNCGSEIQEETSKAPHSLGEYTVTKLPTDFEAGEEEAVCQVCGSKVTRAIDPEGVIRFGETSEEVRKLQEGLNENGYDCGTADGIFGNKTSEAIKALERDYGLEEDGIAWPGIQKMLEEGMPMRILGMGGIGGPDIEAILQLELLTDISGMVVEDGTFTADYRLTNIGDRFVASFGYLALDADEICPLQDSATESEELWMGLAPGESGVVSIKYQLSKADKKNQMLYRDLQVFSYYGFTEEEINNGATICSNIVNIEVPVNPDCIEEDEELPIDVTLELLTDISAMTATPGEKISVTYRLINTGKVPFSANGIGFYDSNDKFVFFDCIDDPIYGTSFMYPGEEVLLTLIYKVTESDLDYGSVYRSMISFADEIGGYQHTTSNTVVTDIPFAEDTVLSDDSQPVKYEGGLSLELVSDTSVMTAIKDGQVTLTYKATNTGNTTLTTYGYSAFDLDGDYAESISSKFPSNASFLAPGESFEFNVIFDVTEDDYNKGSVFRSLRVEGQSWCNKEDGEYTLTGDTLVVDNIPVYSDYVDADIPFLPVFWNGGVIEGGADQPVLLLQQDIENSDTVIAEDGTVEAEYLLTNTGNGPVTIEDYCIIDDSACLAENDVIFFPYGVESKLYPGDSVTFRVLHKVTATDLMNGEFFRILYVFGSDNEGGQVFSNDVLYTILMGKGTEETGTEETDAEELETDDSAEDLSEGDLGVITLTKSVVSAPEDGKYYKEGEIIEYDITIMNDSDQTYQNCKVYDILSEDPDQEIYSFDELEPGEEVHVSFDYTVSKADSDLFGSITNLAGFSATEIEDDYKVEVIGDPVTVLTSPVPTRPGTPGIRPGVLPPRRPDNDNPDLDNPGITGGLKGIEGTGEGPCTRTLLVKGKDSLEYLAHTCKIHYPAEERVAEITKDNTAESWKAAALIYRAEINDMYNILCQAATDVKARENILKEKGLYYRQLSAKALSLAYLYPDDEALVAQIIAETLRDKVQDFCYELNTAPENRVDSYLSECATKEEENELEICKKQILEVKKDAPWDVRYELDFCEDHESVEGMIQNMIEQAETEEELETAFLKMQILWQVAYNKSLNMRYLESDAEEQNAVFAEKVAYYKWLAAREQVLSLLYPEKPLTVEEMMGQTLRNRAAEF